MTTTTLNSLAHASSAHLRSAMHQRFDGMSEGCNKIFPPAKADSSPGVTPRSE